MNLEHLYETVRSPQNRRNCRRSRSLASTGVGDPTRLLIRMPPGSSRKICLSGLKPDEGGLSLSQLARLCRSEMDLLGTGSKGPVMLRLTGRPWVLVRNPEASAALRDPRALPENWAELLRHIEESTVLRACPIV
jgi:hypothetical protein